jgi:N-acetylmuramoyl-L-alanine amidase
VPWALLGLLAAASAGCGDSRSPEAAFDCSAQLKKTLGAGDALLTHSVRAAPRAALESLDRRLARLAARCGRSGVAPRARWARARLRDDIARATGAPADVKAALLAWAELARAHGAAVAEGDAEAGSPAALARRADVPAAPAAPGAPADPGEQGPTVARALWRRVDLALAFDRRREGFALLRRLAEQHRHAPSGARARRALALLSELAPADSPPVRRRSAPRAPGRRPDGARFEGHAVDPDRLGIRFPPAAGRPARLQRVRRWSTPAFSRVVAYFDRPVRYLPGVLPPTGDRPARLYLDFPLTRLAPQVDRARVIQGHLVRGIRLANRPPRGARLVTDLAGPLRYEIYPLRHPYRVVVDLWKARAAGPPEARPPVRVVALDPGHGGAEKGAVGPTGLAEKEVTLAVARHAAARLRARGLEVVLTREDDREVTLEERSAIALATGADLFVSIHANAEATGKQTGVETFYLDVESDQYAARLARRENQAAGRAVSRYRLILADLTTRALTAESRKLATAVQRALLQAARRQRPGLPDRGVRKAIFYVLLTARVPGILAELSFLSSPAGEVALRRADYREALGKALARGIWRYARRRASAPAPRRRRPAARR